MIFLCQGRREDEMMFCLTFHSNPAQDRSGIATGKELMTKKRKKQKCLDCKVCPTPCEALCRAENPALLFPATLLKIDLEKPPERNSLQKS